VVTVALFLRPGIVAVGPLLSEIREQFGLSHAEASLLTTIPNVIMGVLALPTPWLARRYGRDRVVIAALFVLGIAIVGRAFAPTKDLLLLATAGVGAGIAVAGALIAGFIKATYPTRAAFLMGIYAGSLSLGSTIAAALTGPIASHWGGWRPASGIWGLLGVSAVAAWVVVQKRGRDASDARTLSPTHFALPSTVAKAWVIAMFFACDNFLFYGCLSWIATIYRERGFSETHSGLILASYTAVFIVSTPLAGMLSRKVDRRPALATWAGIALIGLVPLAIAPDTFPFLYVSLIALGVGGGFTLGMTLPLDNTREHGETTAWTAFTLTVGYVIAATGPLAVGILRDATGSFDLPLWMLVAVGIAMLGLTPFLKPRLSYQA
jgi:CP family cyanate transporter-like MFS transporter